MRKVTVQPVDGYVGSIEGCELSVEGTRFSTLGELGQSVNFDMQGRGRVANMIGTTIVRAMAFFQDHSNRLIFNDQPTRSDTEA